MAHERQMAYYAASYHGASSAYMMYNLVEQLGRTNNELLWWGILGLTDQFVHERVNFSAYLESATAMQSDVARLNGSADEGASDAGGRLTLASKKEFKFMLLRHWSLYESMVHSRYVASRLGVWQQRGSDSLNIMLAKIGVPLKDCRQRFQSMDAKRRNTLLEQLEDAFRDNGLNDVCYLSFLRQREFRTPVSAADVVYSVTALLQSPTIDMAESQAWRDNFFSAFDVLTGDKQDELRQGIDLAIAQENVVLRQVEAIVQTRQSVRRNKTFRYVIIKDDPDQVHFSRPVILRKIGHYILDTYRYGRGDQRKKKCLPLVVAGYIPSSGRYIPLPPARWRTAAYRGSACFATCYATLPRILSRVSRHTRRHHHRPSRFACWMCLDPVETYMVVGLWANPRDDEFTVSPNEFGANFREAGDRMQARYKSNGFEDAGTEREGHHPLQRRLLVDFEFQCTLLAGRHPPPPYLVVLCSNSARLTVMEIQSDDLPRFIMSLNAQLVRMS